MDAIISKDELINILASRIEIDKFIIGEYKTFPGALGCILRNDKWYLYTVDEKAQVVFTGPFTGTSIVFACAIKLGHSKLFGEYSFSEDEMSTFIHNHFYSERDL